MRLQRPCLSQSNWSNNRDCGDECTQPAWIAFSNAGAGSTLSPHRISAPTMAPVRGATVQRATAKHPNRENLELEARLTLLNKRRDTFSSLSCASEFSQRRHF